MMRRHVAKRTGTLCTPGRDADLSFGAAAADGLDESAGSWVCVCPNLAPPLGLGWMATTCVLSQRIIVFLPSLATQCYHHQLSVHTRA